jgi:hypothetical protein
MCDARVDSVCPLPTGTCISLSARVVRAFFARVAILRVISGGCRVVLYVWKRSSAKRAFGECLGTERR